MPGATDAVKPAGRSRRADGPGRIVHPVGVTRGRTASATLASVHHEGIAMSTLLWLLFAAVYITALGPSPRAASGVR